MPIAAPQGNETTPAIDEAPPLIGPNLAGNQELCTALTKHLTWDYWWPYEQMQQKFWDAWRQIDNAWRVRFAAEDVNYSALTQQTAQTAQPLAQDGKSAKGQSTMPFQQIKAVTDLGEILSFEDGIPFRAEVPPGVLEDEFYQPTQQTADALNTIFHENAQEVQLRDNHRRAFGCFAKYGSCWVHAPFTMWREEVPMPPRQITGGLPEIQAIMAEGKRVEMTPQGAVIFEPRLRIRTEFRPLHIESVMIDPLLPADPIEQQPCPFVKEHINPNDLEAYRYDPQSCPFGFLNVEMAIKADQGHYFLTDQDTQPLVQRLQNRYNLNDQVGTTAKRARAHKKWTCYPMLRITDDGKLDTGDGAECPHCKGQKKMVQLSQDETTGQQIPGEEIDCPTCAGMGTVVPPLKRYVVTLYGDLTLHTTCLRIQEMPEGMPIPILFGADLVEDDAATLPQSKSEAMLVACEQVTRAESQFERSKEATVDRPWKVHMDSPAWKVQNLNKPGIKIPFESDPKEVERAEQSSYDETATLLPYIQYRTQQIQTIYGASDTLLGQISQGRRSALEIGEATEAAKNPLVIMVDRFNHQICGGWARLIQKNLELFGDRDYILRKTGYTYFGKCRIFTAVGKEFLKKMAMSQNIREVLQISAADPTLMPVRAQLWNELFKLTGVNIKVPDGGIQKAVQDAHVIVNKILAQGIPDRPLPSDPHDVYVRVFEGAMKDPYWNQQYPANMELLYSRMMLQQSLGQQQLMAQMAMQQAMNPQGPGGQAPGKKGKEAPDGAGKAMQQQQGSQGATA